jgi:hypothetical protein
VHPEIHVRPYETIDPEETGEEFVFQEITPDIFREHTSEEIEEIRRQKERERSKRYRATYQDLQLNVIAHEDRTLEIVAPLRLRLEKRSKNSGRGGVKPMPRSSSSASSSGLYRRSAMPEAKSTRQKRLPGWAYW